MPHDFPRETGKENLWLYGYTTKKSRLEGSEWDHVMMATRGERCALQPRTLAECLGGRSLVCQLCRRPS